VSQYFSKDVKAKNDDPVGKIIQDDDQKIVVIGLSNKVFHIPRSLIHEVAADVRLKIDFPEIRKYEKDDRRDVSAGRAIHGGGGRDVSAGKAIHGG
jgi:hypothetical protein